MSLPSPVFVIGSYRSGTSIFAWCLGQHSNIVNLPETNWIYQHALNLEKLYSLGTCNGKHSHLAQIELSRDEFYVEMGCCVDGLVMNTKTRLDGYSLDENKTSKSGFRRMRSSSDPKSRWVDATPEHSHYVYGLSKMFPEGKFIHLVRNPEDVVRSLLKFSNAGGSDYSEVEAYKTWYRLVSASVSGEQALGSDRVLRIFYDDLIARPELTFRRCLQFLGESYDENCIEPLQKKINSSKVDVRETAKGAIRWPSFKEIKNRSRKLYSDLVESADEVMQADEKVYLQLKSLHEQAASNA